MNSQKHNIRNISHEQRKKIFVLCRQAGMDSEELHAHIKIWANANSLSSALCSSAQANKIIGSLEDIVNNPVVNRHHNEIAPVVRKGAITDKQLNAINSLKRILRWNDARVSGFARHTVGNDVIIDLSVKEASKLITGLRRMLDSQKLPTVKTV